MYYEVGAKQIQGGRDYQEDSFQVYFPDPTDDEKQQVIVVMADGMGGHAGGAVASELVVESVVKTLGDEPSAEQFSTLLADAAHRSNRKIQERALESPELLGMGCTLVALNLSHKQLNWLSIGDSLLYLIRDGEVRRKNDDHSYGGYLDKLIAAGEEIPETPGFTPRRNMLMSYINGEEIAMIDCPEEPFRVKPGDRLIVASDGLDTVPVDEFPFLSKNAVSAQDLAEALIQAVEDAGKKNQDNTTVIVIDVIGSPGDDTTDQTPGDWIGDTLLPVDALGSDLDITDSDLQAEDGSTEEQPIIDPPAETEQAEEVSPSSAHAGRPTSLRESASGDFEIDKSADNTPLKPTDRRSKATLIAAIMAVLLAVAVAVFWFLSNSDGLNPSSSLSQSALEIGQQAVDLVDSGAAEGDAETRLEAADLAIETLRDSLKSGGMGPEMVMLPAGRFTQGSSVSSPSFDERPPREVNLPGFAISITEITFADYDLFVKQVGGSLPADQGWGRNRRPVINVSWDDARAYAAWLSDQTGHQYRLPSESEWEYAARAGSVTPYWWGWKPDHGRANCFLCGSDWDGVKSAPVGSFPANPWKIHDTSGNVLEWVSDCMHPNYKGAPTDGSSWQESGCEERVVRGGSWDKPADSARVAKRQGLRADVRQDNLGFRLVRELN